MNTQNRERVFIVSIRNDIDHWFEFPVWFNNWVRLIDLLEKEVDEKYYLSKETCSKLITDNIKDVWYVGYRNKGKWVEIVRTITASVHKGMNNQGINVVKEVQACISPWKNNTRQNWRRFKTDWEPMFTLTAQDRHWVLQRIATIGKWGQGSRVYNANWISTTLTANAGWRWSNTGLYEVQERIRRLTPLECFRLMGFGDEDYLKLREIWISDTQAYKMAGNSIVVDVLEKILGNLLLYPLFPLQ